MSIPCGHREVLLPLVLLLACGNAGTPPDAPAPDAVPPDAADRFAPLRATVEAELIALGARGAGVAIVEDGQVTFAEGFGVKGRDGLPVLPTSYFRAGSLTKTFTAVGLLELVDAGLVDLDAPVITYVPELHLTENPDEVPQIRVRDLLTHASGLPDEPVAWADWPDTSDAVLDTYFTSEAFANAYRLHAPPGRMWAYSNLGYDLAGLIIQRVDGRPYPQYMREEVFEPLGMTRTTFDAQAVVDDGDYVFGLTPWGELGPLGSNIPWQRPCGLAFTTIEDLARFATFLLHGDPAVLSPLSHASMVAPQLDTEFYLDDVQWGHGPAVATGLLENRGFVVTGDTVLGHAGQLRGISSRFEVIPERDFAVVYFVSKHLAWSDAIVDTALITLAGFDDLPVGDAREDPAELPRYAGTYLSPDVGEVVVTVEGTGLRISYAGGGCLAGPRSPRNFACAGAVGMPLQIYYTFLSDSEGDIEFLRAPFGAWAAERETLN